MKITSDISEAFEFLNSRRHIDFEDTPDWILDSSERVFGKKMHLYEYVDKIVREVRDKGDKALIEITKNIEGVSLRNFVVSAPDIEEAYKRIDSKLRESLEFSASRITDFHNICVKDGWFDEAKGYGQRLVPMGSSASYIPGGTAKYPSTVLMTSIPARIAGVGNVSITCPAGANGKLPDSVLASAYIAGVDTVYSMGGAQAISALAYGTETIKKVDLICGPGNIFVTLAKKIVFGDVGIDGLYGPTETVVIADNTANSALCAADLLAQAEHDALAKPILITDSMTLANDVLEQITLRLEGMERASIARRSVEDHGLIVVVENIAQGIELSNEFSPEHLSIVTDKPENLLTAVRNAGMVFMGEFSHEVLGDYGAGPSHVMPTAGTARFNSGLGVHTFQKYMPVIRLSREAAMDVTMAASEIAREEGLFGHAAAAEIRKEMG